MDISPRQFLILVSAITCSGGKLNELAAERSRWCSRLCHVSLGGEHTLQDYSQAKKELVPFTKRVDMGFFNMHMSFCVCFVHVCRKGTNDG